MIYLDTGCFVKLYYPEPDSAQIISSIQGNSVIYTPLHELEITNALHLKLFFKNATNEQIASARALIQMDLQSGVLTSLDIRWNDIFNEATELARRHTWNIGCRSLDILHCATAKIIGADKFITTDTRQKQLAISMGLDLVPV